MFASVARFRGESSTYRRATRLCVGSLASALLLQATVFGQAVSAQCADPRGNSYCSNNGQVTFNPPAGSSQLASIASMLAIAKEPIGLFDLMRWMGHRSPNSTLQYLKSSPTRLAKVFADADYFQRNLRSIEVLVPRATIAPAQPWRYDLGHGYCRYEFFAQCPHRLACARCDYYEPKDSQDVLILEAEGNLVRLRQDLVLTDDEQEAIDGDVMTFQKLHAKYWNTGYALCPDAMRTHTDAGRPQPGA